MISDPVAREAAKVPGPPVVFGGMGNTVQNWSLESEARLSERLRAGGAGAVFWHTGNPRDYAPGTGAADVYLGREARSLVARTAGVPSDAPPPHTPPAPQPVCRGKWWRPGRRQ